MRSSNSDGDDDELFKATHDKLGKLDTRMGYDCTVHKLTLAMAIARASRLCALAAKNFENGNLALATKDYRFDAPTHHPEGASISRVMVTLFHSLLY